MEDILLAPQRTGMTIMHATRCLPQHNHGHHQLEDFKTPSEILEEVAAARIVAVAQHGPTRELRAIVTHLVLNVRELRIVLVVLLVLRAVDCRVKCSLHGLSPCGGYYSKFDHG